MTEMGNNKDVGMKLCVCVWYLLQWLKYPACIIILSLRLLLCVETLGNDGPLSYMQENHEKPGLSLLLIVFRCVTSVYI